MRALVRAETWPIRGGFRIARGARSAAEVVVLELHDGDLTGRAECVPYPRYGESIDLVSEEISAGCRGLAHPDPRAQAHAMPAGAARNAIDCALWDLEAKREGKPVWELLGLRSAPEPVLTMRTVSVGSVDEMRTAAAAFANAGVIKCKVDGGSDLERIEAVHGAAPEAKLVVDANEAWSAEQLAAWLPALPALGVAVLEQPLPAGRDSTLEGLEHSVPICADEAFHDRQSFPGIGDRYDMVNIKLDKAGGLSEALYCIEEARRLNLKVMLGCMVSTSLAIEPALLLASRAEFVDLDGPILLEADREGALHEREVGRLHTSPSLWGAA